MPETECRAVSPPLWEEKNSEKERNEWVLTGHIG